jgi:hypothetical protein
MDSTVRFNALWALKNMMFLADYRCEEGIFLELTDSPCWKALFMVMSIVSATVNLTVIWSVQA